MPKSVSLNLLYCVTIEKFKLTLWTGLVRDCGRAQAGEERRSGDRRY